ncbi:MAG: hypothetical protein Kow00120_22700 [Anaerolineae bacterium]
MVSAFFGGILAGGEQVRALLLLAVLALGAVVFARPARIVPVLPVLVALPRGDYLPFGLSPTLVLLVIATGAVATRYALRLLPGYALHPVAVLIAGLYFAALLLAAVSGGEATVFFVNMSTVLPAFLLGQLLVHDAQALKRLDAGLQIGGAVLLGGLLCATFLIPENRAIIHSGNYLLLRRWDHNPYGGSGNWLSLFIFPLAFAAARIFRAGSVLRAGALNAYALIGGVFFVATLYGVRAGWVLTALALGLALWRRPGAQRQRRRVLAALCLLAMALLLVRVGIPEDAFAQTAARIGELALADNPLNRVESWAAAVGQILEDPLFGKGPDANLYGAHNTFLDFALTYGIPYALGWVLAAGVVLIYGWRALRWTVSPEARDTLAALWGAFVLALLFAQAVPIFQGDPFFNAVFWLCAGAVCKPSLEGWQPA